MLLLMNETIYFALFGSLFTYLHYQAQILSTGLFSSPYLLRELEFSSLKSLRELRMEVNVSERDLIGFIHILLGIVKIPSNSFTKLVLKMNRLTKLMLACVVFYLGKELHKQA